MCIRDRQKGVTEKGGTMRLGGYPCTLTKGSKAAKAYGKTQIIERHRHRYEFNNDYLDEFTKAGLKPFGINPDTNLVEVVELDVYKRQPFTSSEYSFAQDILITWYLIDELPQFKTRIVIITSVNDEI